MKWIFFTWMFWSLGSQMTTPQLHEFHLSKCNIEFNEKEQSLQITMHLFIDDLEEALRQGGADQLHIGTEKEVADAESYINRYLQQTFKLSDGEKAFTFQFIGKERTEDLAAIWCYLEIINVTKIKELTVTNQVLMDVFDDQKNIVHIEGPNKKTAYFMFMKGQSTDSVQFP